LIEASWPWRIEPIVTQNQSRSHFARENLVQLEVGSAERNKITICSHHVDCDFVRCRRISRSIFAARCMNGRFSEPLGNFENCAIAAISVLRARAARRSNSQVGLEARIRRARNEGPLSGNVPDFANVAICAKPP
jgi:hypothetical protein